MARDIFIRLDGIDGESQDAKWHDPVACSYGLGDEGEC